MVDFSNSARKYLEQIESINYIQNDTLQAFADEKIEMPYKQR